MQWLNYHHLFYFWVVAKEGSIVGACERLRLAQPTISGQLKALEDNLGERLYTRSGRRLVLTDVGQTVFRYADEIFSIGQELTDMLQGKPTRRPVRLRVGISDVVPKLIAYRMLSPLFGREDRIHLLCEEGKSERLLSELARHDLDLVLSDGPAASHASVRAFSHLLGASQIGLFGSKQIVERVRRGFPRSLDGAPILLPMEGTTLRRSLDHWFTQQGFRPEIVAEFEDSALMKVFGQEGAGLFPAPMAVAADVRRRYHVLQAGILDGVEERFFAITVERKLKHPAVLALTEAARSELFVPPERQPA
ncbi:MAG: transcriptional activator NhaR [Bryobacteraceae bacterium]